MNEQEIKSEYLKDIENITNSKDLMDVKNKYLDIRNGRTVTYGS